MGKKIKEKKLKPYTNDDLYAFGIHYFYRRHLSRVDKAIIYRRQKIFAVGKTSYFCNVFFFSSITMLDHPHILFFIIIFILIMTIHTSIQS